MVCFAGGNLTLQTYSFNTISFHGLSKIHIGIRVEIKQTIVQQLASVYFLKYSVRLISYYVSPETGLRSQSSNFLTQQ